MATLKVKKIPIQTVELFAPSGESLGLANEYEFHDFMVQIKKENVSGYFIKFNDKKIRIDINGQLETYPTGLFDTISNSLFKLI